MAELTTSGCEMEAWSCPRRMTPMCCTSSPRKLDPRDGASSQKYVFKAIDRCWLRRGGCRCLAAHRRECRPARPPPAAPRNHRGQPGIQGHDQERDRARHPPLGGHRRHDPRLAVGASGGRDEGRPPDPAVAESARAQLEMVSCPWCGRARVDVYTPADDVAEGLKGMTVPQRVAVMDCVVNGSGTGRAAQHRAGRHRLTRRVRDAGTRLVPPCRCGRIVARE
ncbi:hypothetical protein QBC39DRAFT_150375 [Podospora conica]|nr:hypothetical protein QBC39DRAFT_150375 [Schizothecium conicum]